jgi:hypothetical protein
MPMKIKISVVTCLFLSVLSVGNLDAQLMIQDDLDLPVSFTGSSRSTIDSSGNILIGTLLTDKVLLDSLDLSDSQRKEIEEMVHEYGVENFQAYRKMTEDGLAAEEIQLRMNDRFEAFESKTSMTLLPHQMRVVKMTGIQRFFRGQSSLKDAIASKQMTSILGLTESEIKALKEKSSEVSKKLKAAIAKLKEEAASEVLAVLPAGKRSTLANQLGLDEAIVESLGK